MRKLSLILFLLALTGCGTHAPAEPQPAAESPVDVRVDRAFYQNDGLHVKVRVTSKTELPTTDIVVNVTGLDEGQVIESYEQRLSEVFPVDELDVGEAALLDFVLKNPALSEYQVQCRWGEESHRAAAPELVAASAMPSVESSSGSPAAALESPAEPRAALRAPEVAPTEASVEIPLVPTGGELVLTVTELEQKEITCDLAPCDKFYTIRATLRNQGAAPIGGIVLASGLQWVNDGAAVSPPESYSKTVEGESAVALDGFVLQPGKEKKLKVAVDRAVPTVPGGQFVPYLRLVASGRATEAPSATSTQE